MKIGELTNYLESLAPLGSQEEYDNCGLLTGSKETEITNALICLDSTEEIIDEAIRKKCNLIIAHHPIIFKGLKKLTGQNYVERTVIKAIQNNIAIYAIHTNLDNYRHGVNKKIGELIGIKEPKILKGSQESILKLIVFVPADHANALMDALFSAGAGHIGNYNECSFSSAGSGTFKAGLLANPFVGKVDERHTENEIRVEVVIPHHKKNQIIQAMKKAHPYEEVAYDLIMLQNQNDFEGAGMIGDLEKPVNTLLFLQQLKSRFKCGSIKHTAILKEEIQRIAWCGGSGSFLTKTAISQKADLYITSDVKYHEFFDAENQLVIADIGHFESEQFTIDLLKGLLQEKFPNFAPSVGETNTNPVNYL